MDKKKKERIQDLNKSLYYKKTEYKSRKRREIHGRDIDLKHDFDDIDLEDALARQSKRKLPVSLFKKIFFTAMFAFLAVVILAVVSLYQGKKDVSDDLITLDLIAQPFVDGGEELSMEVRIQNFNEKALELPDLVVTYSKDSLEGAQKVTLRRSLGDVLSGQRVTEDYEIVLFGQEGDIRDIDASLEYRIEGSSAIFVKDKTHEVVIRSTPTQMTITAPETVVKNQEIEFSVELLSNSGRQIRNALLEVQFPRDFDLIETSRPSDFSDNKWHFKSLSEDVQTLTFKGRMSSFEGQSQSFRFNLGKQDAAAKQNIETVFNSYTHTVKTQKSFLDTRIFVGNSNDSVISVRGGGEVSGTIEFENTLSSALKDVELHLNLNGLLYDPSKIKSTNGFYNSNLNAIVWDKDQINEFALLQPGQSGSVFFTIGTRELAGVSGTLKNPTLEMFVDVKAQGDNGSTHEASRISELLVRANSDLNIVASSQYEIGPFKNSGPIPPKVSKTTSYTLLVQLTNSSNTLDDAYVVFELPGYVKWLDKVSPTGERQSVSFNAQSRQVTWQLGKLSSGTGFGLVAPRELAVQVEIEPSISQKGNRVDLTREIHLNGTDTFTGEKLSFKKFPLNTTLKNEDNNDGRVK